MLTCTLQIFKELQVNYRKMMVDVTRKTYYSLVAHQRIVGFSCYSYMKLQVCTVIYYCYYHQTTRVQSGQCRMPLLLQAKYLQCMLVCLNHPLVMYCFGGEKKSHKIKQPYHTKLKAWLMLTFFFRIGGGIRVLELLCISDAKVLHLLPTFLCCFSNHDHVV